MKLKGNDNMICIMNSIETKNVQLDSVDESNPSKTTGKIQTITLTFGDHAENHVGMQMIGKGVTNGFSIEDLERVITRFPQANYQLVDLKGLLPPDLSNDPSIEPAYFLVIKNAVDNFVSSQDLYNEQCGLDHDKKALMYGRVVNKHARYNLCFDNIGQEPNYMNGRGRIVSFQSVPNTHKLKLALEGLLDVSDLVVEGNYYYDDDCGIGWHGDAERKRVIGVRLGQTMPIVFSWYYMGKRVGKTFRADLENGSIYWMSEKATGNDWKKRKIYTLRHAAGAERFIK